MVDVHGSASAFKRQPNWETIDWSKAEREVKRLQRRIAQAVRESVARQILTTRSTPTTFGCGGNWGQAGPPELDAAHAKSYKPNKGSMTLNIEQTDWPGRAGLERSLSRVSGNYHARFLGGKDS